MIYAIVAVLVLIADQAVKFWTTKNILLAAVGEDCVSLIPGVVHMTNVHNYGAAFGILQNARWPLVIVSLLFVIAIIVLINREIIHTGLGRWTAVLVVAGALGNCIDRALYGYVVDMLEFEFFSFPVFNVADIFVTVCGILFCVHMLFYKESAEVRAANEPAFIRRAREEKEARRAEKAAQANLWQDAAPQGGYMPRPQQNQPEPPAPAEDGLFGQWDFGAAAESPQAPPMPQDDLFGAPAQGDAFYDLPAPEGDPLFGAPAPAEDPELPAPPAGDGSGESDDIFGDYSLDDILSEFGDF